MSLFTEENHKNTFLKITLQLILADHYFVTSQMLTTTINIIENAKYLHINKEKKTINALPTLNTNQNREVITLAVEMMSNQNLVTALDNISTTADLMDRNKAKRLLDSLTISY